MELMDKFLKNQSIIELMDKFLKQWDPATSREVGPTNLVSSILTRRIEAERN